MNLKTFRLKNNLTQVEMGELLGMSQGAICNVEGGRRAIGATSVARISQLTGLSKNELRPDLFSDDTGVK